MKLSNLSRCPSMAAGLGDDAADNAGGDADTASSSHGRRTHVEASSRQQTPSGAFVLA